MSSFCYAVVSEPPLISFEDRIHETAHAHGQLHIHVSLLFGVLFFATKADFVSCRE